MRQEGNDTDPDTPDIMYCLKPFSPTPKNEHHVVVRMLLAQNDVNPDKGDNWIGANGFDYQIRVYSKPAINRDFLPSAARTIQTSIQKDTQGLILNDQTNHYPPYLPGLASAHGNKLSKTRSSIYLYEFSTPGITNHRIRQTFAPCL